MGLIRVKHKGDFSNTERFFNRALRKNYLNILARYGAEGVALLRAATPLESGETANAWDFEIEENEGSSVTIAFTNSHENQGQNIAILLIYGHGTRNGGYVEGNDFVTPALEPLFQQMAEAAWREVTA